MSNQAGENSTRKGSPTLQTAVIAGLETAINKALTLDPSTRKKLTTLQAHCFHLHCTTTGLDLYLIPGDQEVRLCTFYEGKPDTSIIGSTSAFISLISADDPANTLINSDLELHGDSAALITLQHIAHELELDWEAPLASLFGDIIGHQMGRGIRQGIQFGSQLLRGLRRQIEDYIVEESDTLPARWEINAFFNDIDQLSMRTERLTAKINKFSQRRAPE